MENKENVTIKKSSNGKMIILLIIFIITTLGLLTYIVYDKLMLKTGDKEIEEVNKTESSSKSESSSQSESENIVNNNSNTVKENSETPQLIVINGSSYSTSKGGLQTLGTIKVNDISYEIKMSESDSYIGNKKFEGLTVNYVAVMDGSFIVFKAKVAEHDDEKMYFLDKNLNEAHNSSYALVNTFGLIGSNKSVTDIKADRKYRNDIIDSKHLTIAECIPSRNSSSSNQDYVEKLFTFENGKITEQELTVVENVFCTSQK